VTSRVSAVSALPNIGQENLVRAIVGFSLGMVSKVLNPRNLSLGQSLTKAAFPSERKTSSFSSSLVRPPVVFSSASLLFLCGFSAQAQPIWDILEGLLKTEMVYVFPCRSEIPRETDIYSGPCRAL